VPEPELAVHCQGLVKRYAAGGVAAVDGLDLDVHCGECFGLLGPNGAGKTTTVEILEGLLEPTAGTVEILGKRWKTDAAWLTQRLGVSLQETFFPDLLTVRDILALFGSLYARGRDVRNALDMVALQEKEHARYVTLSGGQRQRLAVACALIGEPDLLFLDEPTTGLDPQSRRMLWDVIIAFRKRGGSVVLTTHYMDEAQRLCDRVGVVDHGKMIALGTPQQLIETLGGSQIVELTLEEGAALPAVADALRGSRGVQNARSANGRVVLAVSELHVALPSVLSVLRSQGLALTDLSTHQATLEDVFVTLTGRALRE
jgi:ABC-2 type transport system ATP-binding protein